MRREIDIETERGREGLREGERERGRDRERKSGFLQKVRVRRNDKIGVFMQRRGIEEGNQVVKKYKQV